MRINQTKKSAFGLYSAICALLLSTLLLLVFRTAVHADTSVESSNQHLITIHEAGTERSLITNKDSLREVFSEEKITIDPNDLVEPALDDKLVGKDYQVNIYRARPVIVVDGAHQMRVMTAYQTPKQIAKAADIELHDEDKTTMMLSDNLISDGAGLKMIIDRATPVNLVLYGKMETVYTRAKTVAAFLKEKSITLGKDDTVSVDKASAITANMQLQIWRNGKQTTTVEEEIAFSTKQIQDANQKVGFKEVKTPGIKGKATVTYEIIMKNGQEISRTKIQSVTITEPTEQVETVGSKPSFDGDFAAALAKLRSCEGGYNSWNPAGPYYGAYQFGQGTWSSVADPAKYGNATPGEQDEAARKLYERRGWQPWPNCGAGLPDTYR